MKKKLVLVLMFLFALLMVGCKGNNGGDTPSGDTSFDWSGKVADKVRFVQDKSPSEIDLDEFDMSLLVFEVTFEDGTKQEFKGNDSHFALNKDIPTNPGTPRFKVICTDETGGEVESANFVLTFVSYARDDEQTLEANQNVIMAKRNNDKIDFVIAKTDGMASGQMQFKYNAEKMTLGEVTNGSSVGYVNVQVNNGVISIGFTNEENLAEGTVICSIAFNGDYRGSELAANEDFDNACWMIVDTTPAPVSEVLFYVSRK